MKRLQLVMLLLLTSCCGPVLRTARTLPAGETELTGGLVLNHFSLPSATVALAHGITDNFEIEARYEELGVFAIGPRYQVIDGGASSLSLVTFASIGLDAVNESYPFGGAGLSLGKPLSREGDIYWTVLGRRGKANAYGGRRSLLCSYYTGVGYRAKKSAESPYFWGGECGVGFPTGIDLSLSFGYEW